MTAGDKCEGFADVLKEIHVYIKRCVLYLEKTLQRETWPFCFFFSSYKY
jgi:hypothetical protein